MEEQLRRRGVGVSMYMNIIIKKKRTICRNGLDGPSPPLLLLYFYVLVPTQPPLHVIVSVSSKHWR